MSCNVAINLYREEHHLPNRSYGCDEFHATDNTFNIRSRQVCDVLSNAAVKSEERLHNGECVKYAYIIESRAVVNAPKIVVFSTPKY